MMAKTFNGITIGENPATGLGINPAPCPWFRNLLGQHHAKGRTKKSDRGLNIKKPDTFVPDFFAISGTPRRIRTPSLLVRSQTLYPVELWAHLIRDF